MEETRKNNVVDALPPSVRDAVSALLKPYGVDVETLMSNVKIQSQHSTRGYCNGIEAARYLGVSVQTLWRLVKSGGIKATRFKGPRSARYSYDELDEYMTTKEGATK